MFVGSWLHFSAMIIFKNLIGLHLTCLKNILSITPIQMGLFEAAQGGGGKKFHPYLKFVIYIPQWWKVAQL